jgi:ComF family protein
MIQSLIDWILPITCVLCGQTTNASQPNICPACTKDLPWIQAACLRCGLPLPSTYRVCGQCLRVPPPYQRLQGLFSYDFPVDQLILGLKFQHHLLYARLLGSLMAECCARYYTTGIPLPSMLIPVPLHKQRLRQRGFNQATELAKWVKRRLGVPIGYGCLQRVKYTEAQMELPLAQRAGNVKQVFAAKRAIPEHVAVIDDVVTSGHTIQALSQVLQKAGAKQIDVWCIARAIKKL